MGVKNLWDILESCKKTLPLHHLQNKRVCIDLSCWIIQLETVSKSYCSPKDKVYLKGLFHRLRALIALNCSLIFVSDGSIPAIKLSTYRRRLNGAKEALGDAENSQKLSSLKRNKGSEFSCMIKEAKSLGTALGIPCLDGIEEAETQCALLNSESLCDGCFTSDSDAFLFGARTVYRDVCLGEGGYVVCYEMDDIERKLGFGRNSLIALALLIGSDYTQGVRGFGPESACQIVRSIGDSAVLQRFSSEGYSFTKIKKSIKKHPRSTCTGKENIAPEETTDCNDMIMVHYTAHTIPINARLINFFVRGKHNLPTDKQFLHQVIDAYLKPKCHSAKSISVNRVLPVYPFSRTQLHQTCSQYFDWSSEKTDEYILPKFAERELRRYANLRSTSSGLGVHLPFNGIPVKCPISDVVKQRKVQGRDYFEVSWENIDGLKTSAVPTDLVESACPEKILEFHQRKAQKQKPSRRPRQKKVNKNAEMKEIDEKLYDVLLDIEQESTTSNSAAIVKCLRPDKMISVAQLKSLDHSSTVNSEKNITKDTEASNSLSQCSSGIIDLTSPSPTPLRARCMLRCEKRRSIELIELSESDNDMSPQHARKALELRMFISNIRNDL